MCGFYMFKEVKSNTIMSDLKPLMTTLKPFGKQQNSKHQHEKNTRNRAINLKGILPG